MNRVLALSIAGILLVAPVIAWLGSQHVPTAPLRRPNVVLVILDTLRADRLGSYGYEHDTSPELDGMARRGVRFEQAIAQSSWTRPSIGSMLTSLPPRTLGIYQERGQALNERFVTLSELLKNAGYRTLGATSNPNINSRFGFDQGFDRYIDSSVVFSWMALEPGQKRAVERPPLLAPEIFKELDEELDQEHPSEQTQPHYLQINLMENHEWPRHDEIIRPEHAELFSELPPMDRHYGQTIRQVSHDLKAFTERLRRRPGWEDTLFVVVSDHGEGLGSHPHVPNSSRHGHHLYESHVRVPWIMFGGSPDLPEGRVVDRPVRLLDLMPTILDLTRVARPSSTEGRSLVPLLREGGEAPLPRHFFVETEYRATRKRGVYTDRWEYIEDRAAANVAEARELQARGGGEDGPRTNRLDAHPDRAEELGQALRAWEADTPRISPTKPGEEMSPVEEQQLRALGYLE
ncbi:MAG: sulfatase [Myxococcota bacterium]